ncbi:MAG: hypothetical protein IJG38_07475 [Thermoguttaceae bacterium]|nr:hypothetical protein [Thermoguttaceae bacterium]
MVKNIFDLIQRYDEGSPLDDGFKIFMDDWNEGEIRECLCVEVVGKEAVKYSFKLLQRSCSNIKEIEKANKYRVKKTDYCKIQKMSTRTEPEIPPFFARIHKDNAGRLFIIPCAPDTVIEGEEN